MNPTDLALEAASYITASGSPAANNATMAALTVSQKRRMANDLTAVMQFIAKAAPALYRRRDGVTLGAPATADVTVSTGSKDITTAYGYMEGATVNIGGLLNEIRTEGGSARLIYPYTGAGGTQPAVFYSDSVILDDTVSAIIGDIWPEGKAGVAYGASSDGDYGRRGRGGINMRALNNREDARNYAGGRVGCPSAYWVDTFMVAAATVGAGLIVTGALTPDGTGFYPPIGTGYSGTQWYVRNGSVPYQVRYEPDDSWYLSNVFSNGLWKGPTALGDGPAGNYTAFVNATGTATVAFAPSNPSSSRRLRFVPLPEKDITLGYDVRLRAPKFTAADLGTDDVASTKTLIVPDDYHESIVRPLFLEAFASSPWFRTDKEITARIIASAGLSRARLNEYRAQEVYDGSISPGI